MEERHLHFNLISGLWFLIFLIVVVNAAKWAFVTKWNVPGLSDLIKNI